MSHKCNVIKELPRATQLLALCAQCVELLPSYACLSPAIVSYAMLDTCYDMLEFIVTVTVLLVALMFHALVEFVVTLGWQEVHASELYLVL